MAALTHLDVDGRARSRRALARTHRTRPMSLTPVMTLSRAITIPPKSRASKRPRSAGGIRTGIPAAARPESGAPGLRRRACRRLPASACSTSAAAAACSARPWPGAARTSRASISPHDRSKLPSCTRSKAVSTCVTCASRRRHTPRPCGRLRHRHLHGNAGARARTRQRAARLARRWCGPAATSSSRPQPQSQVLALAVVGAEYVLNLLPRGTHTYERFIKPSELARWARARGARRVMDIAGLDYDPFQHTARARPTWR